MKIKGLERNHEEEILRLTTVEGHIPGIQRMLEKNHYCIDVIRQIQAVQSAFNTISAMILDEHLNACLLSGVKGDNPMERQRVLNEITQVFETANKV